MPPKAQPAKVKVMSPAVPARTVEFGREVCGSLEAASEREWLVTNGIGGYASGTLAGLLTRRYHGLLVAALKPPLGRTLLVAKLDESLRYDGRAYALATNRWVGGALEPQGYRQVEKFRLEGTTPVWAYACADALLEKRIWMLEGRNITFVRYTLLRASMPVELEAKALVNYRDFHSSTHAGDWRMNITQVERGLRIEAFEGATPFYLLSATASAEPAHDWYRNFDLAVERARGLDDHEDHLHAGTFCVRLAPGESVTLALSSEPAAGLASDLDGRAAAQERSALEQALLDQWSAGLLQSVRQAGAPSALRLLEKSSQTSGDGRAWVRQLVLAADQFLVKRPLADEPDARSVIAGYHWFSDWGRDTMIALPGLTLATGQPELARQILRTYARFVSCGMLPNMFPEAGQTPEYNSVDAALWFFEAVRQYYTATKDTVLLRELFPVLAEIVDWHMRGTRHGIHMNPDDGLLTAGEPGVQLTWMDAKIGDCVVTPRMGKPVEVNALWYNALVSLTEMARLFARPTSMYETMAKRVRGSFQRFWNAAAGYCFDVLDGPTGNDAALRPNQIFAVSLPESPLEPEQQRAVVDVCARHLLTSHGLRSLAPEDSQYRGQYDGSPQERDAVYHQGTVWGWLLGPFVLAHLRVYGDAERAAAFLEPMAHQMQTHGLGTLGEIFDGDAPFTPRGCIAQAWTVAETLRAWTACQEHRAAATPR